MKTMQKLVSILTVLALVFTLSLGVFAASNENPHTITIENPDAAEAHQYQAYQVFKGIYSPENTLTDVEWGEGVDGAALLEDLVNHVPAFANCTNAIAVANVLEGFADGSEELREFASYVEKHLATPVNAEPAVATADSPAIIDVVGDGYYYVKDVTPALEQDTYSDYMLFVEGDVTVEAKDTTGVTSQKKVKDINDSNLEGSDWQDTADYDIGDPVPFQLTGTVAEDLAKYNCYKLIFHDKECEGLTFQPETVKVFVDGVEITEGFEVVTACSDECTFEIRFANLKAIEAVHGGSVITVEYFSILNEHAVIGTPGSPDNVVYGNPNEMRMEYSNNPIVSGEGEEDNDTGFTPWDEVVVYTYEVDIDKVDENGNPLDGADFELYKWYLNEDVDPADFTPDMVGNPEFGEWVLVPGGAEETTGPVGDGEILKINGKVVTKVTGPDGIEYFKLRDKPNETSPETDIYLKVSDVEDIASLVANGRSIGVDYYEMRNGQIVPVSGNFSYTIRSIERAATDGATHFSWTGVDDGWYMFVETQTPEDYNSIDPIVFEIIAEHTEDPIELHPVHGYVNGEEYFMPLDENIGIIHANIENHSGAHLPSTGGIGTVLFYVLGGLLVLGAGVLLVVKKLSDAN